MIVYVPTLYCDKRVVVRGYPDHYSSHLLSINLKPATLRKTLWATVGTGVKIVTCKCFNQNL